MAGGNASVNRICQHWKRCSCISERIAKDRKNDPPWRIKKGGVTQDCVNSELDELR